MASHTQALAGLKLVEGAMVECIAGIAIAHLIATTVIERHVEARGEGMDYGLQGLGAARCGGCGFTVGDKEGQEAAGAAIKLRHQTQLALGLQRAVQIDVGMYLLGLLLVDEGQAQKLLAGGGIDVHGLVVQHAQLLQLCIPLMQGAVGGGIIALVRVIVAGEQTLGIFLYEVVPRVGLAHRRHCHA